MRLREFSTDARIFLKKFVSEGSTEVMRLEEFLPQNSRRTPREENLCDRGRMLTKETKIGFPWGSFVSFMLFEFLFRQRMSP
jgi:hypothetical protein